MGERALSFGAVAAAYERFRPGYPDEVIDRIAAYAGEPIRTALEIGAGTGKATRLLASRGIAVTAVEPDPAMLAELRLQVPSTVTTVQATFEQVPLDRSYDLVLAAASLHWTAQEGRWDRVAALLRPGGVFASFGGPFQLADTAVEAAARAARSGILDDDDDDIPVPSTSSLQWPGTELDAEPSLGDVRQSVVERRSTIDAEDWIGHLATISAYLVLPEAQRREVLSRIRAVLPDRVEVVSDIVLHLARRV